MNRQYEQQARRELEALKRARDIKRELDEAARYKAALEQIEDRAIWELAGFCRWCGCRQSGTDVHSEDCPVFIAKRALHPEDEE